MIEKATRIHLGGKLGQLFGKEWNLHVKSPAEALQAINVNTKGKLRQYLETTGAKRYYKVAIQTKDNLLTKDEIRNRSGCSDIYILPTIKASNSGWGKIIAGAVLVIVGVLLTVFTYGAGAAIGAALIGAGLGMIVGGITQLLTPTPKTYDQLQSYNFQGSAAVANQGVPVPVVYGRALVWPTPICVSYNAKTVTTTASTSIGVVTAVDLPGGGTEYVNLGNFFD